MLNNSVPIVDPSVISSTPGANSTTNASPIEITPLVTPSAPVEYPVVMSYVQGSPALDLGQNDSSQMAAQKLIGAQKTQGIPFFGLPLDQIEKMLLIYQLRKGTQNVQNSLTLPPAAPDHEYRMHLERFKPMLGAVKLEAILNRLNSFSMGLFECQVNT